MNIPRSTPHCRWPKRGADIWLLDEPANGLDVTGVAMLEGLIATHRLRGGIAVVTTHQPLSIADAQTLVLG